MENASKALLMAAGVLLSLMVISMLWFMFNGLKDFKTEEQSSERQAQVTKFNEQYETYARDDLRGSELLSVLNKVIDYNERKADVSSTAGGTTTNEGAGLAYDPMTISFTFANNDIEKLRYDNTERLFKDSNYAETNNKSNFKEKILNITDNLESSYGKSVIQNLSGNISAIYLSNSASDMDKIRAFAKFKTLAPKKVGTINNYNELIGNNQLKEDIYKYYEFTQFKRLYFKCTGTKYNKQTGRITELTFDSTGKLN